MPNYLGGVDEQGVYFRWEEKLAQGELTAHLNAQYNLNAEAVVALTPESRGKGGRLRSLRVDYRTVTQQEASFEIRGDVEIRRSLHQKFLYSSAFFVNTIADSESGGPDFLLRGVGWGHGVGLCQIGALGMGLEGYAYQDILQHYYPESTLTRVY